jgi:prevent-host-death family protein
MREIAFFEAKSKLGGLIDQVAAGEEFLITRHGKPVARLTPVTPAFDRAKARQTAELLLEVRTGVTLGDLSIKELINAGRP